MGQPIELGDWPVVEGHSDRSIHCGLVPSPTRWPRARSSGSTRRRTRWPRPVSPGSACRSWPAAIRSASSWSQTTEPNAFERETMSGSSRPSRRAWAWRSRTRASSTRPSACWPRPMSARPSWRSSPASRRAWPRTWTCSRCTTWSGTRSRRSSMRRSWTSASSTATPDAIRFPYTIERGVRFPDEPMRDHRHPQARAGDRASRC